MKIKHSTLKTPIGDINLQGTDYDFTQEEVDEMLGNWTEVLTKSSYFKFSVEDETGRPVAYVLPENVLKNSFLKVVFEEEKCQDEQVSQ